MPQIMLADGNAPAEVFPGDELARLAADILQFRAGEALQYGELEGYMPLRELVSDWLTADGVDATAEDVVIVTGAKQNIDMTTRALCSPGDKVVVGAPTYMNGIRILARAGAVIQTVPHDKDGLDVDAIEAMLQDASAMGEPLPKLIYDVPDFHNPTGTVLSEERREKLVEIASRFGVFVLEDNPYRWTRFEGEASRPLKTFDRQGVVISTGTFAKILGPGLRLGWVHASRAILDRILLYKVDGGTSPFCQILAHEFYKTSGSLERHLLRVREALSTKREAMLEALEANLGGSASWSHPGGGYYVWVTMAHTFDTDALAKATRAAGVEFFPGSIFFASKDPPRNHLRLAYAFESIDRINEGVAAIARLAGSRLPIA
jgi:2-aminoadipate transaminase